MIEEAHTATSQAGRQLEKRIRLAEPSETRTWAAVFEEFLRLKATGADCVVTNHIRNSRCLPRHLVYSSESCSESLSE